MARRGSNQQHHHARLQSKASQYTTTSQDTGATVTLRDQYQRRLTAACARGIEDHVRQVLAENGLWSTSDKDQAALRKALQKASARDNVNIIRLLLQHGAEIEARADDEFPPLFRAAQTGQRAVVEELLMHGPDVEAREIRSGQTPLFAASVRGCHAVVSLLLAKGAQVDAKDRDGRTPLLALATNTNFRSMETASLLARHGANLEAKDQIGRTPLLWAATNRNYDLAKTLLERGASVSAVNYRGRTALHLTVDSSSGGGRSGDRNSTLKTPREEMIRLLLQHGADANATSDGGWKPLHNAAQKGLTRIVAMLHEAGADVNAALSNGMTALHWAAFNGEEEVAQLIWSFPEADLGIRDTFGRAAWLCAAERGHDDLVELLSPGHNSHRLPKAMQDATQAFNATVVEFKQYGEKQRVSKPPVFDLLYRWDEKNGRPMIPLWTDGPPGHAKTEFKWIHLPANNLAWVETLMINWFIESGCRDLEGFKALMRCLDQEHRGPLPHANYMRPFCQRISSHGAGEDEGGDDVVGASVSCASPTPIKFKGIRRSTSNLSQMTLSQGIPGGDGKIVMFMPYLHYETDENRQKMMDAVKIVSAAGQASSHDKSPGMLLLEAYLNHKPPLHPRRTLDQFFYRGIDTSARDRDQVVYRYCEDHGQQLKVFMVDQLWVLVLNKDLIITCFPERWGLQNHKDPLSVLDGIVGEMNAKTRPPVRSVYDLAILISGRCSGMFSRHRADDQDYQFLDMFESSVGRVTEDLTHLFHQFEQASSHSRQWVRPSRRSKLSKKQHKKKHNEKQTTMDESADSFDKLLDIGTETSLLTEVRDIRDELNILTMILNSQLWTLGDLKNCLIDELSTSAASNRMLRNNFNNSHVADIRKRTLEQERHLKVHKRDIQAMDEQAERLYQSLTDLLDLKQKHSNALEARFASEQALAAAREGQTVMVFTIVTIIFLPMSFIAAYFGINMDAFNDLTTDYVATWTFGGGLGISVVFIFMAFTVVDITRAFGGFAAVMKRLFSRDDAENDDEDSDNDSRDSKTAAAVGEESGVQLRLLGAAAPSPYTPTFPTGADLFKVRSNNTMRTDIMELGLLKTNELDLVKTKTGLSMLTKTRSAASAVTVRSRHRAGFGDDDLEWGRHDREMSAKTC